MSSLLRLKPQQKDFFKSVSYISTLQFLSYSFGIETTNTMTHNRSSFVNRTLFQTKMGKVYTRFQTKTAQKLYPLGPHIPIWLI